MFTCDCTAPSLHEPPALWRALLVGQLHGGSKCRHQRMCGSHQRPCHCDRCCWLCPLCRLCHPRYAAGSAATACPSGMACVFAGVGPLHVAAREGQVAALELLLAKGADKDAKDGHGWTALQVGRPLPGCAAPSCCLSCFLRCLCCKKAGVVHVLQQAIPAAAALLLFAAAATAAAAAATAASCHRCWPPCW